MMMDCKMEDTERMAQQNKKILYKMKDINLQAEEYEKRWMIKGRRRKLNEKSGGQQHVDGNLRMVKYLLSVYFHYFWYYPQYHYTAAHKETYPVSEYSTYQDHGYDMRRRQADNFLACTIESQLCDFHLILLQHTDKSKNANRFNRNKLKTIDQVIK